MEREKARRVSDEDQAIGLRMKSVRIARGLSQSQLADRLGVTFQQVQKYENGVNRMSGSRIAVIADFLKIPIAVLVTGADEINELGTFARLDHETARLAARLPPHAVKSLRDFLKALVPAEEIA